VRANVDASIIYYSVCAYKVQRIVALIAICWEVMLLPHMQMGAAKSARQRVRDVKLALRDNKTQHTHTHKYTVATWTPDFPAGVIKNHFCTDCGVEVTI